MKRKSVDSAIKSYRKAVSAFFRKAKSMARRGYVIDVTLPKEPKRITEASVRRIKKVSSELYKKSSFVTEDGKVISGEEGRKYERKRSARKAAETKKRHKQEQSLKYDWEIAFEWLEELVERVEQKGSKQVASAINDIVNAAVVRSSEREVGLAVVSQQDDVRQSIEEIAEYSYSAQSTQYSYALTRLSQLLGGGALTASQLSDYESGDEDGDYEYR